MDDVQFLVSHTYFFVSLYDLCVFLVSIRSKQWEISSLCIRTQHSPLLSTEPVVPLSPSWACQYYVAS